MLSFRNPVLAISIAVLTAFSVGASPASADVCTSYKTAGYSSSWGSHSVSARTNGCVQTSSSTVTGKLTTLYHSSSPIAGVYSNSSSTPFSQSVWIYDSTSRGVVGVKTCPHSGWQEGSWIVAMISPPITPVSKYDKRCSLSVTMRAGHCYRITYNTNTDLRNDGKGVYSLAATTQSICRT